MDRGRTGESRAARRSVVAVLLVGGVLASIMIAHAQVTPPAGGGYAYGAPGGPGGAGGAGGAGGGGLRSIKPLGGHELGLVVLQFGLLLLVARALHDASHE